MRKSIIFAAMALGLAGCGEYSDGERVGTIQKFSTKGLVAKTWEGEMLLGGLRRKSNTDGNGNTTTSMVANIWMFTVEDPALIAKVQQLMESGTSVRAHYRQEIMGSPFRTETGIFGPYFLTKVEAAQ